MTQKQPLQKLVIIVGPTSSGKSELAVKVAKKIGGAVLSSDSRQVYRGMDIGTGKITGKFDVRGRYMYKGIRHYGIDIASPTRQYSVAQFQKYGRKAIADIAKQGLVPIICGGTAQWIDAVVYEQEFPKVRPNAVLRKKLERLSTAEMFATLQKLDPDRAADIDRYNPHRLIRALEIVMTSGKPVPRLKQTSPYDCKWLGINPPAEVLQKKISQRLKQRLRQGMLKEVALLHKKGLSWKRLEQFGLEYRFCALHLQSKLATDEMTKELFEQLFRAHIQYTKRQMTWWKRNKNIQWSLE